MYVYIVKSKCSEISCGDGCASLQYILKETKQNTELVNFTVSELYLNKAISRTNKSPLSP